MASISETSDDGSNGGDPNKKPEELHKNPQEEEEEENLAPIPRQIPEVHIERTVALVPRCHYPKLSLISRAFHRVISSPRLYQRRLHHGLTEPVLYALIVFFPDIYPSWYILNRNNIPRLIQITSLPPMNPGSAVVTIGYNMYVIGGCIGLDHPVKTVFVIDCRFHTCRYLPTMHKARDRAAAGVVDGKIYVIGGCEKQYDDWIEVFDVENGTWSTVPDPYDYDCSSIMTSVVMQNKIYILDGMSSLVYEPRQGTWQSLASGTTLMDFWRKPCCVIEDLLYSFDPRCVLSYPILVYDPDEVVWRPVKGVSALPGFNNFDCRLANLGGKLMVLGNTNPYKDTLCVEISLERRQGGEIWGNVDSAAPVLSSVNSPYIEICCSVTF